jgi:hypothetical protein
MRTTVPLSKQNSVSLRRLRSFIAQNVHGEKNEVPNNSIAVDSIGITSKGK